MTAQDAALLASLKGYVGNRWPRRMASDVAPDLHRIATEQAAEIERLRLERDILPDTIEEMQADRTGYGVIIAGMVKP